MIAQESGLILANDSVSDGYFKIRLACGDHYKDTVPGQFVTLQLPGQSQPLLRRPFSIHRILQKKGTSLHLEILYRVVGGFTGHLSETKPGGSIDILGPLGHGFSVSRYSRPVVLAAGGIGVAPLMHLADCLKQKGTDSRLITVFLGGRTKADILCREEFLGLGTRIFTATEDGIQGSKGFVTDPLLTWLKENTPAIIYACGPHAMLEAVGKIAESKKIACEVSIETLMACGLGVCMGCAVSTNDAKEGYRHVCKDGPVFDSRVLA